MRSLPRMTHLAKLVPLLMLAGAACGEVKTDSTNFQPAGVMEGTVTYTGPLPCTVRNTPDSIHVVGAAVMLIFNESLLPPPEGFGTTAGQVAVVSGDELFRGVTADLPVPGPTLGEVACPAPGTRVSVSTTWKAGPVPAGRWQVRGFYDYDGDFSPLLKIHQLPTKGDIGGGAIANLEEVLKGKQVLFQTFAMGSDPDGTGSYQMPASGARISGITVNFAQELSFSRPVFHAEGVVDERPAASGDVTMNGDVTKGRGAVTDAQGVVLPRDERFFIGVSDVKYATTAHKHFLRYNIKPGVFDTERAASIASPYFIQSGDFVQFANTDRNGKVRGIPESPMGLAVADLFPQAIFAKLDARLGTNQQAQPSPAVVIQGINLGAKGDFSNLLSQTAKQVSVDKLTIAIRPTAICLDPLDSLKTVYAITPSLTARNGEVLAKPEEIEPKLAAQLGRPNVRLVRGCLPRGKYQFNLVYPTGQAWTIPNEAGVCLTEVLTAAGVVRAGQELLLADRTTCQQDVEAGSLLRTVLSSQALTLTVGEAEEDSFCEAITSDDRPETEPGHLGPADYCHGTPKFCLTPLELEKLNCK